MSSQSATPVVGLESNAIVDSLQTLSAAQITVTREQSNGVGKTGSALQHTLANLQVFQHLPINAGVGLDDLTRMKMSLQSGIDEEVKYALKRYLKYSVSAPYVINLNENRDLLQIILPLISACEEYIPLLVGPVSHTAFEQLQKGLTSVLLLRNLVQDSESTPILASDEALKQFILFILVWANKFNTAESALYQTHTSYFSELLIYILDLMEAISSYIAPAKKDDPYFQNLCVILRETKDRYCVISILRSLSRLLVRSKADEESAADNLDDNLLNKIVYNLLIDRDEELIMASLDFLYQYILPGNERVTTLLSSKLRYNVLSSILPVLLSYRVSLPDYSVLASSKITLKKRVKPLPPANAPELPEALFRELCGLNEPMRATSWLRCCFERSNTAEVTQILLWKTYEQTFGEKVKLSDRKLITAVDFIKNVSNAFPGASALVVVEDETQKKKFVIRGIQPRKTALSIKDADADMESLSPLVEEIYDNDLGVEPIITDAAQVPLPDISFPKDLSDVSKASASFLSLLSGDATTIGRQFVKDIKPFVLHSVANVPPLNGLLSEFINSST